MTALVEDVVAARARAAPRSPATRRGSPRCSTRSAAGCCAGTRRRARSTSSPRTSSSAGCSRPPGGSAPTPRRSPRASRAPASRSSPSTATSRPTTCCWRGDALGVVDWEHADAAWLPFTDLAYAAVDAIAVARRLPRAEALAALRRDPPAAWREHRAAFGAEAEALGLHACFLHHAANELGEPGGGDGQFGAAARALLRGEAG